MDSEIPDWLKKHRKELVKHICDMGAKDSGYANYAIGQYLKLDPCPFPELKEAVRHEVEFRRKMQGLPDWVPKKVNKP